MRDFRENKMWGFPGFYRFLFVSKYSQCLVSALLTLSFSLLAAHFHGSRFDTPSRFISNLECAVAVEMLLTFSSCLVAFYLLKKMALSYAAVILFAVMDLVLATFSVVVASVLVSALMDFPDELICVGGVQCWILLLEFVLALISWLTNALSHLFTLGVLTSGV